MKNSRPSGAVLLRMNGQVTLTATSYPPVITTTVSEPTAPCNR